VLLWYCRRRRQLKTSKTSPEKRYPKPLGEKTSAKVLPRWWSSKENVLEPPVPSSAPAADLESDPASAPAAAPKLEAPSPVGSPVRVPPPRADAAPAQLPKTQPPKTLPPLARKPSTNKAYDALPTGAAPSAAPAASTLAEGGSRSPKVPWMHRGIAWATAASFKHLLPSGAPKPKAAERAESSTLLSDLEEDTPAADTREEVTLPHGEAPQADRHDSGLRPGTAPSLSEISSSSSRLGSRPGTAGSELGCVFAAEAALSPQRPAPQLPAVPLSEPSCSTCSSLPVLATAPRPIVQQGSRVLGGQWAVASSADEPAHSNLPLPPICGRQGTRIGIDELAQGVDEPSRTSV